ncbi:hypothetical protein [Streptomyces sp. NPDC127033]|uniref:hypothetical protein n=1 Tax=Streptomyces sp. NPDC127033 TaxID=3347110 RepID=UPI003660D739
MTGAAPRAICRTRSVFSAHASAILVKETRAVGHGEHRMEAPLVHGSDENRVVRQGGAALGQVMAVRRIHKAF